MDANARRRAQVVGAAVAGLGAGVEEQPAAPAGGAAWGAWWAGEDALGGTPAEELVQSMHSARAKVRACLHSGFMGLFLGLRVSGQPAAAGGAAWGAWWVGMVGGRGRAGGGARRGAGAAHALRAVQGARITL